MLSGQLRAQPPSAVCSTEEVSPSKVKSRQGPNGGAREEATEDAGSLLRSPEKALSSFSNPHSLVPQAGEGPPGQLTALRGPRGRACEVATR